MLSQMVKIHKTLSEPNRLKLLKLLLEHELCVCEMVEVLNISQPLVSQHLRVLKTAGLVTERREGKWVYYRTDETALNKFMEMWGLLLRQNLGKVSEMNQEFERWQALGSNMRVQTCKAPAIKLNQAEG